MVGRPDGRPSTTARCALALGLWLVCIVSHGADLTELYGLARLNDPTFQGAQFALQAAVQKEPQAFSALLPALAATGSEGWTNGSTLYTGTPRVTRGFQGNDWALQLTQPLYRAQNWIAYQESHAVVEQAVAQYAGAEQDLALRTAQAYFDVLVAEESIAAADAQVTAFTEQLNAASRSFKAGVSSVTDVDDARSREALAEAQREASKGELDGKRAALEAIVGALPDSLSLLRAGAKVPPPDPPDVATWIDRAKSGSPVVKAAEAADAIAEREYKRTRALRLPTVDLTASYGGNYSSGNIINPVDYASNVKDRQLNVQVSVPLFDAGGIHAQVAEARARHAKATADVETARRQVTVDARQAYAAITSGIVQIHALEAAIIAGRSAVKGNQAGYGLGIRINSDVLNAQQQLYGTLRDYAKARYDALLQGLKLKAAAGALSEADLRDIDRLFDEHPPSAIDVIR
jgi:outer membrane protein